MPQDTLKQIEEKLASIRQGVADSPAGTDFSKVSEGLAQSKQQLGSMLQPVAAEAAEVQPPEPPIQEPQLEQQLGLQAQLEKQRASLEAMDQRMLDSANAEVERLQDQEAAVKSKQEGVMAEASALSSPFEESYGSAMAKKHKIEENMMENQALAEEMNGLLTESIAISRKLQTQKVPGLAGIQQSTRMINAQNNINGRLGVIQAVMAARDQRIGVAENFINQRLGEMQSDRNNRLNYLESLFNFYETSRNETNQKIFNLTKEQKEIINNQRALIEYDLEKSEKAAERIKEIMQENPLMAGQAGLTLNDSEEEINKKLADWQYKEEIRATINKAESEGLRYLPAEEIHAHDASRVFMQIDSKGNVNYFLIPQETPDWKTAIVGGNLYRVDTKTGSIQLMVAGNSIPGQDSYVSEFVTPEISERLSALKLEPAHMEVVLGIMRGESPPMPVTGSRTAEQNKILAGLAALGFDSSKAHRDYTAMINTVKNMTSAKAMELRRAVISLEGSTDQAERLYADWQATGLPTGFSDYNRAALNAAARTPGQAGVAARTLLSHIEDMAAELAVVYRGGGQATDDALAQARRSLNADWNQQQFSKNLALIRENLQIRRNSLVQAVDEVLSTGVGGQYAPSFVPIEPLSSQTPSQDQTFNQPDGTTWQQNSDGSYTRIK